MTTTDAAGVHCAHCSTVLGPDTRFCVQCGTPRPATPQATLRPSAMETWQGPVVTGAQPRVESSWPTSGGARPTAGASWPSPPPPSLGRAPSPPPYAHPTPYPTPYPAPYAPPAPRRGGAGRWVVVGLALLVAVAAIVTTAVVLTRPDPAPSTPGTTTASGPVTTSTPSSGTVPGDPRQQLLQIATADSATAEGLVGWWIPQLSAKREGMVVQGVAYDASAILADHQRLRAAHPDALLVWSGSYTSFRGGDFWVTVVASPSSSAVSANAWCDSAGIGPDDCYAKRLSHTEGYTGNTVQR